MWHDPTAVEAERVPSVESGRFSLCHKKSLIGTLLFKDGRWVFQYSDQFKTHPTLRTITEFPDLSKTYESSELWPFFLMRIPSLRQTSIKEIVEREHIDEHDEVKLLKRFGRRTVANPFELVSS
jgi:HipA-like protein